MINLYTIVYKCSHLMPKRWIILNRIRMNIQMDWLHIILSLLHLFNFNFWIIYWTFYLSPLLFLPARVKLLRLGHPARLLPQVLESALDAQVHQPFFVLDLQLQESLHRNKYMRKNNSHGTLTSLSRHGTNKCMSWKLHGFLGRKL